MVRKLVVATLVAGFVASTAGAATIGMNVSQLGANGWNTVIKADSGGRGSVTDRSNWAGSNGIQFTNGDNGRTPKCWSAISTANYAGTAASSITSLKMRVYGTEGDGSNWQPPAFMFAFAKAPTNLSARYAWWLPWADGTPRVSGSWQEYDAMTDGQWYIPNANGRYSTFAAMVAATPTLVLASDAEIATMSADFGAGATGAAHSFNVGHFSYYNEVAAYHDSARGTVDWFEVGIAGNVTRFDLNDVPEPATLMALLTGMGLVCIRRNRR